MDKATLSNLIGQSKQGNRKAMEQLLIYTHTPVFWQCRRLLNDSQLAEDMTERVLKALASQIDKIENADHFHKWLGNVTATRCMRKREQSGIREYTSDLKDISFPSKELSKAETALVAQILADSLPEDQRICLLLSVCCRVSTKAIAQMTGFSEEAVSKYVTEAELGIREQMQIYQNQGVVFPVRCLLPPCFATPCFWTRTILPQQPWQGRCFLPSRRHRFHLRSGQRILSNCFCA